MMYSRDLRFEMEIRDQTAGQTFIIYESPNLESCS